MKDCVLINALKKKQNNESEFEITQTYLGSLLDKIFG